MLFAAFVLSCTVTAVAVPIPPLYRGSGRLIQQPNNLQPHEYPSTAFGCSVAHTRCIHGVAAAVPLMDYVLHANTRTTHVLVELDSLVASRSSVHSSTLNIR